MRIDIISIFPYMFTSPLSYGLLKRARETGVVNISVHDLRGFTHDKHRTVDDYPFGGGPGMVMKPGPIFEATDALRRPESQVVLLSPQGRLFTQTVAQEMVSREHLIVLCGRYEGVDERVALQVADEELSIGDYVLSGGEVAALALMEAVVRLLPGALGSSLSLQEDSLSGAGWGGGGLLEYPQYTRPAEFRGLDVPGVLLSGDHAQVRRWRREQALERTYRRRPELLESAPLTPDDRQFLKKLEGAVTLPAREE
ncbi:MAG: tRNA (guanosine(37)-N1)-methyltransferase TrmD [Dehalococcoidia bacterium]|nr:tRNA (guanosine(37)-N1)-methyltransferase TrmD [Dehalococcoidia bacterium]